MSDRAHTKACVVAWGAKAHTRWMLRILATVLALGAAATAAADEG